jgi:hypothetical protein
MKPESSVSCLQESVAGTYPELDECGPHHTLFLKDLC